MNKLAFGVMFISALLPLSLSAKQLPNSDLMIERLNQSGLSSEEGWSQSGNDFEYKVQFGVLKVSNTAVESKLVVEGEGAQALQNAFAYAGIHCVTSSLVSIDMGHNQNLVNSMLLSYQDALKAYDYKTTTMVWGYHFKTKLTPSDNKVIVDCSLSE